MRMRFLFVPALAAVLLLAGCGSGEESSAASAASGSSEPYRAIEGTDEAGRPYLSPQDVDPAVGDIQQQFVDWDLPIEVTDVYDDETLAIVLAFQYSQELVPDGVIGPNTWDALADPTELPDDVDPLTLIEIATVALESPSDARAMLEAEGLPLPVGAEESPEPDASTPEDSDEPDEPASDADSESDADEGEDDGGSSSGAAAAAVVELSEQQVYVYDASGAQTHQFAVSSGKDGLTPVGTFNVQSKSDLAWSSADETITMQWMTRFNGGIGFHGIPVKDGTGLETPLGERPVSSGCIRMADEDARTLQQVLPGGAEVVVRA